MTNAEVYLFSHKPAERLIAIDQIRADLQGTTEIYRKNFFLRDIVEPFYIPEQPHEAFFFLYGGAINPDGPSVDIEGVSWDSQNKLQIGTKWQTNWKWGWDVIKPFYQRNQTYLISYAPPVGVGRGTVAIDRVNPQANGTQELWRGEWQSGWSTIEPFYQPGDSNAYLVEYKRTDGTVAIDRVNDDLQGTKELWRGQWWGGCIVRIFYLNKQIYTIVYDNAYPLHYRFYHIPYPLSAPKLVYDGEWSGWQIVEPFYYNENVYFFTYSGANGIIPDPTDPYVEIAQVRADLKGVEKLWMGRWSKRWAHIKPFYRGRLPYYTPLS